jgi:hypothetical protein
MLQNGFLVSGFNILNAVALNEPAAHTSVRFDSYARISFPVNTLQTGECPEAKADGSARGKAREEIEDGITDTSALYVPFDQIAHSIIGLGE